MPVVKFIQDDDPLSFTTKEDLLHLLAYMYRFDKSEMDTVRTFNPFEGYCSGCEPFFFPKEFEHDYESVFQFMMLHNIAFPHLGKKIVRHRMVSFASSDLILPQDLDPLGREIALFYKDNGFIAAYAVQADHENAHIHIAVNNASYYDGHLFSIPFEFNHLSHLAQQWYSKYEAMLDHDTVGRERREGILYGYTLKYGQIPLSAAEQIKLNSGRMKSYFSK